MLTIGTYVEISLQASYKMLSLVKKSQGKYRLQLNEDKGKHYINLDQCFFPKLTTITLSYFQNKRTIKT